MSKENLSPASLELQPISIPEIHHQFKQEHPAGFRLKYQQVRWGRFRPSHISMYDWQSPRILGLDANNLEHCYLTYQNTLQFIKSQNESDSPLKFNSQEQSVLTLMAETHDWGEGVTKKGDINRELKTLQDEQEELAALKPTIASIIGSHPQAEWLTDQIIFHLSPEGKHTKIGQAFDIIEKIGYVQTALRSWQKSLEFSQVDPKLSIHLQMIPNIVLTNNLESLTQSAQTYPYVKNFLKNQKYLINQAFGMKTTVLDHYDLPEKIATCKLKFSQSKSNWHHWSKQNL